MAGRLVDPGLRSRFAAEVLADGEPDVAGALTLATTLANEGCQPGTGHTLGYLRTLASLGAVDATAARAVEPHLDARAILDQAGLGPVIEDIGADEKSTWGVYAAHAPGHRLQATSDGPGWTLSGVKPWCSLSRQLSHAIVTAHVSDGERRAFAVRLDPAVITTLDADWVARGLVAVPSGPIAMDAAPAAPVGESGWYLERPGFAWGGIGVAAVWYGIAFGLLEALRDYARTHAGDRIVLAQLGSADELMFATATCLEASAREIDAGSAGATANLLAQRVRAVTARAAEAVQQIAGHALGPGPLVGDEGYARRVADLTVYLRQHHGERDLAQLGQLILDDAGHLDA